MISLDEILALHKYPIADYGGANGIRDLGMFESAIARPLQTFNGEELYPTILEKAAALAESLIVNYPFIDGNKRTGISAMYALLLDNGLKLTCSSDELYNTTISISTGMLSFKELVEWLKSNSEKI